MTQRRCAPRLADIRLPGCMPPWQRWLLALLLSVSGISSATAEPAPLKAEPMGTVNVLPQPYPDNWLVALDSSFFHMLEGKGVIVDPLAKTVGQQYKGMFTASFMAAYTFSARRNEHYVAESFFARGGRGGKRTDVVTVWDPQTLAVTHEIEIPAKRLSGNPKRMAMTLVANDRFLLVYNFTPAQSVSVVNVADREFIGEIAIAGCGFVIATGKRSFSSICANGSLLTTTLNRRGQATASFRTNNVFDVAQDPAFEAYARINGIAYFPTFQGNVVPVAVAQTRPKLLDTWSLVSDSERSSGWRPGGSLPIIEDQQGMFYVLMHPNGQEGTHKNGGGEVWVFDATARKRTKRIKLQNWGLSLGLTGSKDQPLLAVTNAELGVDIYDANSGEHLNTLLVALDTPFRVESGH